jgi:hypothetical protein
MPGTKDTPGNQRKGCLCHGAEMSLPILFNIVKVILFRKLCIFTVQFFSDSAEAEGEAAAPAADLYSRSIKDL